MKHMLYITALFLVLVAPSSAQTQEEIAAQKKEINKVKKSSSYLYGEATMPTAEEAKALAEEILYSNINEWVAEKKKAGTAKNLVLVNTKKLWSEIALPRGNMFRAFYYIKKSDIIPAENTTVLTSQTEAGAVARETKPEAETQATPIPATEAEKPAQAIATATTATEAAKALPEYIKEVNSLQLFADLGPTLKRLKREGKVTDFNTYSALAKKEEFYLVIYNREGKIEALLTPGENRINLKTGQPDSTKNYPQRGAIGFKTNE